MAKLIAFEGIDRSGKSTQAKLFAHMAHVMSFPERKSASGQKINDFLHNKTTIDFYELHKLFVENRNEASPLVCDLLSNGKTVIVDRYIDSGLAYSLANGVDLDWCNSIEEVAPRPHVVLFFDINPHEASKRKGFGVEKYETLEFQNKVYDCYKKIQAANWVTIDATQSSSVIYEQIKQLLFA